MRSDAKKGHIKVVNEKCLKEIKIALRKNNNNLLYEKHILFTLNFW